MVKLGVVSDTHGHVTFTRQAVQLLDEHGVDEVIHCGDIGSIEIPPLFASWPTHFVFGNVDRQTRQLENAIAGTPHHVCHGRFGEIVRGDKQIAIIHSDDMRLFDDIVHTRGFDLVCYGHTHVAKQEWLGETLVLNPGAIYRADPHSIAVVELPQMAVTPIELTS